MSHRLDTYYPNKHNNNTSSSAGFFLSVQGLISSKCNSVHYFIADKSHTLSTVTICPTELFLLTMSTLSVAYTLRIK